MAIGRQCIWPPATAGSQPRYGAPCGADADCAGAGAGAGSCRNASRAYCPPKCDFARYRVAALTSAPLSDAAVRSRALPKRAVCREG